MYFTVSSLSLVTSFSFSFSFQVQAKYVLSRKSRSRLLLSFFSLPRRILVRPDGSRHSRGLGSRHNVCVSLHHSHGFEGNSEYS
jgi:hypothetical protein